VSAAFDGAGTDDAGCVLALDVRGTMLKAGLVDRAGAMLLGRHRPAGREPGPDAVLDGLLARVDELAAAWERGLEPAAVRVVAPGIVDEASGTAALSANFGSRDRRPRLTGAALGDQAGRRGAALLASRRAGQDVPAEAVR
jgi:predicted NBD/HSP70 family sugar kinase